MSALYDLASQIQDEALRNKILEEIGKTESRRRFGLVWEDHLVESTRLFGIPIRPHTIVTKKRGSLAERYQVIAVDEGKALCKPVLNGSLGAECILDVSSLVAIADFGEPIYPCLTEIDRVQNAPNDDTWHTLIEADNYHALQLLRYLYPHSVDCIYIDPPYNTGAKDWKYNNNYIAESDSYRHSKWLSFMEKRLRLAKELLNPDDGVLVVMIDEKEYLHLGMLLEQVFQPSEGKNSHCYLQMISTVISKKGNPRDNAFARCEEYLFVLLFGKAKVQWSSFNMLFGDDKGKLPNIWNSLVRGGTHSARADRPKLFYPIYIDEKTKRVVRVGDYIDLDVDYRTIECPEGQVITWPLKSDGSEGRWGIQASTLREAVAEGVARVGNKSPHTGMYQIQYLKRQEKKRLEEGLIVSDGRDDSGALMLRYSDMASRLISKTAPRTIWCQDSHDASTYGTKLLKALIPNCSFTFPKSLYAIEDVLRFFVSGKPEALIVDFFAGSGTSAHAVLRLNKQDGGHRRIISVTNNEVGPENEKKLCSQGLAPGDDEWEALGIARYVTFPRIKAAITGKTPSGEPIKGNYGIKSDQYVEVEGIVTNPETGKPMRGRFYQKKPVQNPIVPDPFPMSDGFAANAIYFKLGFLDRDAVALGRQFKELLPILWMKAGCHGPCPSLGNGDIPDMLVLPENKMAILVEEAANARFKREVMQHSEIETAYIVTDSPSWFTSIIADLDVEHTYQLYSDYLENFQINVKG